MSQRGTYRQDVQALRGIAVLLVLLFHAQIGGLAAGYLGVDVFFVLSGYLISGLVHRRLVDGGFSFSGFYVDRAKRLLPSAYVVYALTAIAAYWLLTATELERFVNTLWGALTFSANIVLWTGTDYFSQDAKFNPLLHVWSLSIEEQFYFLLPLALFLIPSRYRLPALAVCGTSSLALCLYLAPQSPAAAFYLLPTRAWELALGGVLALAEARRRSSSEPPLKTSFYRHLIGLAAILLILITSGFAPGAIIGSRHPGFDSLLVCLATAVLLAVRSPVLNTGPVSWVLARLGDISYSLYLVHWPLFAFATNVYVGQTPPLEVRVVLLVVSVVSAFLLFILIEEPFRKHGYAASRVKPALAALAATSVLAVLAVGVQQLRAAYAPDLPARAANFGLHQRCEFNAAFEPRIECVIGNGPNTLVWGDSFAMHLVPGLAEHVSGGLWQATKSACGPIIGIAPYRPKVGYLNDWSRDCLAFNESVLGYLTEKPNVTHVILSSPFTQFVEEGAFGLVVTADHQIVEKMIDQDAVVENFRTTIELIQALDKKVVIVGPTPATGFDVGLCHERKAIGAPVMGVSRDCQLSAASAREYRSQVYRVLSEVSDATGVRVVNLSDYLCDETVCRTQIDGVPLYWDAGHLSIEGSRKVMSETGAREAILARDH